MKLVDFIRRPTVIAVLIVLLLSGTTGATVLYMNQEKTDSGLVDELTEETTFLEEAEEIPESEEEKEGETNEDSNGATTENIHIEQEPTATEPDRTNLNHPVPDTPSQLPPPQNYYSEPTCNEDLKVAHTNYHEAMVQAEISRHESAINTINADWTSRGGFHSGGRQVEIDQETANHQNNLQILNSEYQVNLASIHCL